MGCHMMGDRHIHLQLIFEDGTVWLARIPRETYRSFDNQLGNEILASECATLRWLESVDVPAPRLHGYGLYDDPQNKVGVAFMLIDKMPGRPFNTLSASEEQKTEVLGQWADILCTLSSHPFQESGSLRFDNDGTIKVGPMVSDKTAMLPCMGPFQHAKDLYSSWAVAYLRIITEGQLFSDFALDAYIMFKYILRQVKTGPWLDRWRDLNSGPFFLKHPDDEGSHVLVDDEFQITGVIDWTFARIVPTFETFGPSLISADNDDLFFGEVGLTNEDMILGLELRRRGSPFCFFQSDEIRRLLFGLGMAMSFVYEEAIGAFQGLVATFEGQPLDWDKWWHANNYMLDDDEETEAHMEVEALLTQVNAYQLLRVASSLRHGKRCMFFPGNYIGRGSMMGSSNYHVWILFEDRVTWLARIPRDATFADTPSDLAEYIVESEYATLKWLGGLTFPTPRAHGYGLASDPDNLVGSTSYA
ncbi:hypothetical protein NW757_011914 [Fusarium falciforme]|nr:hypothetical protein NW757_011914 [Fusarium falciforme]